MFTKGKMREGQLGLTDIHDYINLSIKQKGPTVQHRELYLISCNTYMEKNMCYNIYIVYIYN